MFYLERMCGSYRWSVMHIIFCKVAILTLLKSKLLSSVIIKSVETTAVIIAKIGS